MEITGPFLDEAKKLISRPACWYLRYSAPKRNADGTQVLDEAGRHIIERHRPYYETKAEASADLPRIREQNEVAGSGQFIFNRGAADDDYESALKLTGGVTMLELAKFWRLHHPEKPKRRLRELMEAFLEDVKLRHGDGAHYSDLKSRGRAFIAANFGERYADTVTRQEILAYVKGIDCAPRTMRNHKTAVCEFFNWLVQDQFELTSKPAAGIKKRILPKEVRKEIEFLLLDFVTRYLRTAERYDPEMVAHEIVQLIAGVRADDEMADFDTAFVHPQTREVVIPAAVAKTGVREVIDSLEENFWAWWTEYAPEKGRLRPKYHGPRWERIRVLASIDDQARADELGRLPIKILLRMPEARAALRKWPWNARRRTFCTFHMAKHQSAAKTALIMRHRGSAYTLHNSYRGLGVTQEQGRLYFELIPVPVAAPVRPIKATTGIIRVMQKAKTGRAA